MRAKLAEFATTRGKPTELNRIKKVEQWMKLRNEENMALAAATEKERVLVVNLYGWKEDYTGNPTRPHTLREPKSSPERVAAVFEIRKEQKTWAREKTQMESLREGFYLSVSTVKHIISQTIKTCLKETYRHLITVSRMRQKEKI